MNAQNLPLDGQPSVDPASPDDEKWLSKYVRRGAGVLARLAVAAAILGGAIYLGLRVPVILKGRISAMPAESLTMGVATIATVLKALVDTLPSLWDYVVSAIASALPKIFGQIAVAAFGVGFVFFALDAHKAVTPPAPASMFSLNLGGSGQSIVMNESDALLTAYVVFPENSATLVSDTAQIGLVNNLTDSLVTCLQKPTDTVELIVRGYASSSGSDEDNRNLYKNRADYVSKLVKDRAALVNKQSQFNVTIRDWGSLDVMKIRRLFKDTDAKGTYLENAGALNRRAEIKVHSAGSCS